MIGIASAPRNCPLDLGEKFELKQDKTSEKINFKKVNLLLEKIYYLW
jgi:hypothetical protein